MRPIVLVIFGGGGDLSWRKLVPALFDLWIDQRLPEDFQIVLLDRITMSNTQVHHHFFDGIKQFARHNKEDKKTLESFAKHVHVIRGDFTKQETYRELKQFCKSYQDEYDLLFYLAVPPSLFGVIPPHLKKAALLEDKEHSRIIIEKPLGYDLNSFLSLNETLLACMDESQIFRIDHYLGKETVQNILAFRFANPQFEPIWNRRYIDYVTITMAEDLGVEHRGGYFEHAGTLRDMVQNHMMQLLCLVAMEPMTSFDPNEIRNKKLDVLHAIRPILPEDIQNVAVRGQYGAGKIDGKKVLGYREEEGVSPNSQTETFVALKLLIDNWRWHDVPFYLRTGKRLPQQSSQAVIHFKRVPHQAFPIEATIDKQPSELYLAIQPTEGIMMTVMAKCPGPEMRLRTVDLEFNYEGNSKTKSPDAYETLLWDVMKNDPTEFMRADQVAAAWKVLMPIIDMWSKAPSEDFPNYEAGTWGPIAADRLLAQDNHYWPPIKELQ